VKRSKDHDEEPPAATAPQEVRKAQVVFEPPDAKVALAWIQPKLASRVFVPSERLRRHRAR
jgi:hypothetical protein